MSERFYKIARPDGWDFYTGETINYRDSIGKTIKCPKEGKPKLCSPTVIHASRDPNQCFIGGRIPCSLYLVEGKPVVEDEDKCGFKKLQIIRELDPAKVFRWRYEEACNPVNPLQVKPPKKITKSHLDLLRKWDPIWASVWDSVWASVGASVRASAQAFVWDSVWASVGDSVWASVGDSVWDSVRASVRASVWDSVWASVRGSIRAYCGYIFASVVKKWKYVEHKEGEYPFQPAVDLWKMGLVPSYDGKLWRLHGGKDARVLWEGMVRGDGKTKGRL